jgi:hypothetical protein
MFSSPPRRVALEKATYIGNDVRSYTKFSIDLRR